MPTRRGARSRGGRGASRRAATRETRTRARDARSTASPAALGGGGARGRERAGTRARARRCRRRAEKRDEVVEETETQLPRRGADDLLKVECFADLRARAQRVARPPRVMSSPPPPPPGAPASAPSDGVPRAEDSVSDGATRRARDGPRWRSPCRAAPHPRDGFAGWHDLPDEILQAVFDVLYAEPAGRRAVRARPRRPRPRPRRSSARRADAPSPRAFPSPSTPVVISSPVVSSDAARTRRRAFFRSRRRKNIPSPA